MGIKDILSITALSSALVISGCGGSDSDNSSGGTVNTGGNANIKTTSATVSSSNAQALGVAAARGIKKAVFDNNATGLIPGVGGGIASGVDIGDAYNFCETGSVSYNVNSITSQTINYNQCSYGGLTFNGQVTYQSSSDGDTFTTNYNNLTVTGLDGQITTLDNYNVSCTGLTTDTPTCTYLTDWSVAGEEYQLSDVSVSNTGNGYDVTVTVADTDNGSISVQTTASVSFDCPNDEPGTGSATFTGADDTSGQINFDSCTGFTITVDGVSQTYSWSDYEI